MTLCVKKQPTKVLFILVFTFIINCTYAQKLYTGASGGNWGTASNWQGLSVPTSSDSVLIPDARNVTIDVAAVCKSLTMQTGSTTTTLTISGSNSLTVSNLIKLEAVTPTNNRNHTIAIGALVVLRANLLSLATINQAHEFLKLLFQQAS